MKLHQVMTSFIVTFGYIGRIKYAPGTFGSIVAFPICYLILFLTMKMGIIAPISGFNLEERQILTLFSIALIIAVKLFFVGLLYTAFYIKATQRYDPKEVVIDEVVGQMFTIIFTFPSVILLYSSSLYQNLDPRIIDIIFLGIMPFILFRLFDIMKPWPISWLDKNIKNAFGVMIDDLLAAVFAIIVQYVVVFLILDFFPIPR